LRLEVFIPGMQGSNLHVYAVKAFSHGFQSG
jgi:hypothetical protein